MKIIRHEKCYQNVKTVIIKKCKYSVLYKFSVKSYILQA